MDRTHQSSATSNSFSSLNNHPHNLPSGSAQLPLESPETPLTASKDNLKEQLATLRAKLEKAEAIQRGAENLLHQVGAGQGLKRKDISYTNDSQSINPLGVSSATSTATNTLHASVEAELDLANRNVKALIKEIEALESLSATSPRKATRRLQSNNTLQSNPQPQSHSDDTVRIQSEIDEFIQRLYPDESLSCSGAQIRKLSDLVKSQRGLSNLNTQKLIRIGLIGLSDSNATEMRAECYRLLRHSTQSLIDVNILRSSRIDLFFVKTISRDNKSDYEKLQALIFVRSLAHYPRFLTLGIVRAISSIAETADEMLRQLSIQTLGELMVRDPQLLAQADGIKVIMQSLTDNSGGLKELAPYLTSLIMAMVDRPVVRQFLKPGVDFESALAAITEVNEPTSTQAQDERVRCSAKLVVLLLKSWTGLMFLCLNKKRSLRMYVQSMKVPSDSIRLILLDALFEIFQIKTPAWFSTFMSGKRLTYYQKPGQQTFQSSQPPPANKDVPEKVSERATLSDHYLAILLLVFFDVELLETLIEITESKGMRDDLAPGPTNIKHSNPNRASSSKSSEVQKKASLLIAEILDLSNRILPLRYGTGIQSLPRLFELAASFQQGDHRSAGTAALREVDSLHRTKNRLASPFLANRNRSASNSSHWEDLSLFRSFGIGSIGLSSVNGSTGSAATVSVNGFTGGVANSDGAGKAGVSGVMGSSASVNGLASGLSLITGSSAGGSGGSGPGGIGSGSGIITSSAGVGSDHHPPQNVKLFHHSDPRFRIHFINIDDVSFRNLVIETQVLVTKDHTRWNLDKLLELIEGTLYMNPKRLEELTRSTKIMKRLLGFLHPFEGRYPYIKRTKHTSRYTKLACSTLQTLLSDPVGVKFLAEDKLVEQIGLGLRQLDQHAGVQPAELLFSQSRVEDTLTHGYFEMLGVLSKYPEGIKLMEKFKIFTSFYALCEMRTRDDLVKEVIENVDYSINGHCRLVLSKALTSSYKHVRLFATHHLEKLITRGSDQTLTTTAPATSVTNNININNSKTWSIRLLLTQLYDPSPEVCGLAVEILEEACAGSIEVLETVVKMRPSVENLGDVGAPLLLRFLSTSVGARYLNEIEWTEREMDEWFRERNRDYVIQLEVYLSKLLNADGTRDEEDDELIASVDGSPPPHFFGELVKTVEGQQLLTSKGHFQEFVKIIRQHGLEENDLEIINQLKTVLWAIGNIGASVGGLTFLESEGAIEDIASIAQTSKVFSVRGTCYFVLGLISSTSEGSELLEDVGWVTVQTPLGMTTGICVPSRIDDFVVNPNWKPKIKSLPNLSSTYFPPQSPIHRKILVSIANLSNHLLANNSSKTLTRLKMKRREAFQDFGLFYRALKILATYHYRSTIRKFVFELFGDIKLDLKTVQQIHQVGVSMKVTKQTDTSQTIMTNQSLMIVGGKNETDDNQFELNNLVEVEDYNDDSPDDEDELNEKIRLEDLPFRSGSGLLEAYDKTDYCSDDDHDDDLDDVETQSRLSDDKNHPDTHVIPR